MFQRVIYSSGTRHREQCPGRPSECLRRPSQIAPTLHRRLQKCSQIELSSVGVRDGDLVQHSLAVTSFAQFPVVVMDWRGHLPGRPQKVLVVLK